MTFRDDEDAVRARADALQRELDDTEDELAEAQGKLAAAEARLAERDAADAQLKKLAERGAPKSAAPTRPTAVAPTKLELLFGASPPEAQAIMLPVLGFLTILGLFVAWAVGAFLAMWAGALAAAACVGGAALAWSRNRPVTTLARARRAIEEERRWAATRPYEVEHYPEVMIGPGGDHLVLRLRFAEREPPQLGDMVRGAGGKPIGDGMVAFEVGMRAGTHTNPDGSEVQTEYVEPLRARKAIRALDETLLTPLVKAHGLRSVRPYLALGSGLEPELIELLARGG